MDPTKIVPMSAWEQIAVVIVFAILLGGLGYMLVKMFIKAIADVNAHYAQILKESNTQWQQYFDARSESSSLINNQIIQQLTGLTTAIADLTKHFDAHDEWERMIQRAPDEEKTQPQSLKPRTRS